MKRFDIGPDIEVKGDEFEAQQVVLKEMAEADAREYQAFDGPIQDGEINSCDALRILDGVPLVQEDEDPFQQGWKAREEGKSEDSNPHSAKTGSLDHWMQMEWKRGWNSKDDIL